MLYEVAPQVLAALVVGVALAGMRFVGKFLGRAVSREIRDVVTDVVDERLEKIVETTQTLKPNGGSSLADAVNRIEKRLEKIEDRIPGDEA